MTGVFRARILAGRRSGSDEGIEVFGRAEGVLAYADRAAMDANVRAVLGNDDLTLEQKDQRLREYGTSVRDIFMLAALGAIPGVKVKTKKQKVATNRTGAGRYTPDQPRDARGNPILRTNARSGVLVQPNGSVTCGQHACGMVLNTQGRPVAVDYIISSRPPDFTNGSSQTQLQRALRDNGVGSTAFSGRNVSDLRRYTSDGRPAIATVQTGPNTYHAVVVDGVTTRGGQQVVAIRDPAGGTNGGVYYETVTSFQSRFTGDVIRMNNQ